MILNAQKQGCNYKDGQAEFGLLIQDPLVFQKGIQDNPLKYCSK